jgi:hypothetical protein
VLAPTTAVVGRRVDVFRAGTLIAGEVVVTQLLSQPDLGAF